MVKDQENTATYLIPKEQLKEQFLADETRLVKSNHHLQEIEGSAITTKTPVKEKSLGLIKGKLQRKQVQSGQMYIAIEGTNVASLNLRPSAQKLFRLINAEITSSNYQYGDREKACTVYIPLDEMMELCGATNTTAFIREAKKDIRTLASLCFTEEYKDNSFIDLRLSGGLSGYNAATKTFYFTVSGDAMNSIFRKNSSVVPLHEEIFKIDSQRYRTAWPIGTKLINYRWSNPEKDHQLILSVEKILDACNCYLPSEEKISKTKSSPKKYIVKPFVDALNHLTADVEVLEYWGFCHEKGIDLTDEELLDSSGNEIIYPDYSLFKTLYIRYALAHEHEDLRSKRLEGREKERIEYQMAKEKRDKEKEKSRKRIQRAAEKKAAEDIAEDIKKTLLD